MLSEKSWISGFRISSPKTWAARSDAMAAASFSPFSFTSFALPARACRFDRHAGELRRKRSHCASACGCE